ncbi:hypothetical protein ACU8V1_23540 [Rhizobium leguminosarum]
MKTSHQNADMLSNTYWGSPEAWIAEDDSLSPGDQAVLLDQIRFRLSQTNAPMFPVICHTKLPTAAHWAVSLAREGKMVLLSARSGDQLEPYRALLDEVAAACPGRLHIGNILSTDDILFADESYDAIFFAGDNEECDGILAGMSEEEIDFVKRNLLWRAYEACNLFHVEVSPSRL